MKRFLKLIAICVVCILCLGCCGCKKTGPIPNGFYCFSSEGENIFVHTEHNIRDSYGWEIEGDKAQAWVSGTTEYKAKIVERDGKIYLECYKWRDLFDILFRKGKKQGTENVYEVIYDADAKTITLELVE
ncbi:MAG: hypothetical protein IJZ73_02470 [Clostridia bacterium]|nr:hypothetical protein [Clostridia bacterium]